MLLAAVDAIAQPAGATMNNISGIASVALSAVLIVVATFLLLSHWQTWVGVRDTTDEKKLEFHRRQFQRRSQTSAGIVLLGMAIFCGRFVEQPRAFGMYWFGVLLLLLWLTLNALRDIWATRYYFSQIRQLQQTENAQLRAALEKARAKAASQKESPADK